MYDLQNMLQIRGVNLSRRRGSSAASEGEAGAKGFPTQAAYKAEGLHGHGEAAIVCSLAVIAVRFSTCMHNTMSNSSST